MKEWNHLYHFGTYPSAEYTTTERVYELGDDAAYVEHGDTIGTEVCKDWYTKRKQDHT
jgi:hypothetical protein